MSETQTCLAEGWTRHHSTQSPDRRRRKKRQTKCNPKTGTGCLPNEHHKERKTNHRQRSTSRTFLSRKYTAGRKQVSLPERLSSFLYADIHQIVPRISPNATLFGQTSHDECMRRHRQSFKKGWQHLPAFSTQLTRPRAGHAYRGTWCS